MDRGILHCDMNNFYASVECMLNPALRPYPVAVCGSVADRHGIVLAKNYAAKALGVKTGQAVWQAKQCCRELRVVEPHYEHYLKFSRLAREIYARYTDLIEPYGMDECWLDITGFVGGTPLELAQEIRRTVKAELGVTISVGVSFNKIFAKLGSDLKKPDAVTEIPREGFREQLRELSASELLGVGRSTTRTLDKYGIHTIGQLAGTSPEFLARVFGKCGLVLWRYANGEDHSPVTAEGFVSPVKSVGHGTTTVEDMKAEDEVWPVLLELTQEIGHKLRLHGKCASAVAIHVRDNTLFTKQWQTRLGMPTQSPLYLAQSAFQLFRARYSWEKPIRSITVQAIELLEQDDPRQLDLYHDYARAEKHARLDDCVEEIRRRFGEKSIRNAALCTGLRMASCLPCVTMPTGMVR